MKKTRKPGRFVRFVAGNHRYVYLGGSVPAVLTFVLCRNAAPSALSFLGAADSVPSLLLQGVSAVFLALAALALAVKLLRRQRYGESFLKRPGAVRLSRYLSYLTAAAFLLAAADRLLLGLAAAVAENIGAERNPEGFLASMIYMAWEGRSFILTGVWTTVRLALFGTAIAFVFSILMAFMRLQKPDKRDNDLVKLLKTAACAFAKLYIFIIRGTPMMVQALIFYYAGFALFKYTSMTVTEINRVWSFFVSGLITISLNSTAYLAEVLRGGVEAVDPGQREAARSLGMTDWQAMRRVIFPQAVKNSIPAIGNEFIINIKDSSVLSVIGVMDLMFATTTVSGIYFRQLEIYCVAAILYLLLTWLSSRLLTLLARRLDMPARSLPSSN